MANHNPPGKRDAALSEEPEPSWRPQDPDVPDERSRSGDDAPAWREAGAGEPRDARRWESDEDREVFEHSPARSFERSSDRYADRYGPGARGPGAGHYGEERLRELQRGRQRDDRLPSAGSFEDRYRELGPDAGIGAWPDHTGSDPWHYASQSGYRGRDFERERRELSGIYEQHTGYAGARRRSDERIGEPAGSYSDPGVWGTGDAAHGAAREIHVHRGTGPHRGKGPVGYQRSDERIRELVCESLTDDDQVDASHIEVGVSGGEVTLSGTVDDRCTKRAAEDCAYSVSGVRDVQNRLRVGDDAASTRSNPAGGSAVGTQESPAQDRKHRA